jgi:ubiquitin-protein ligase
MRESPRLRRLRNDRLALEQLAADSSIFEFNAYGTPPDFYIIRFQGTGVYKPEKTEEVRTREIHEVHIRLGASYPRMMPELAWKTPIFHPNVSAGGIVCLGGYGTHWVPSLALDELCSMLWDMVRYENYDEKSPYNREAAAWVKDQTQYSLPIDGRPLRNRVAGDGSIERPVMSSETTQRKNADDESSKSNAIDAEIVFLN